ncbi:hypothetical protein EHS25_001801 [Saitozyma podzolica]|uniref:AB hydrolase-1 domain-containing protein n=1 Tax=Saitozyma podzolica TaxID=1890683 RepID=A0A427YF57_9TREE|nr:hypothetical protein EHS25_001801 [Saitozyma podzolica]
MFEHQILRQNKVPRVISAGANATFDYLIGLHEETVFDDDDPFYTEISNFVDAINGAAGQDATLYTYDGAMSWASALKLKAWSEAGVCLSNGKFLSPGDKIDITITGWGTLSNTVGQPPQSPPFNEGVTSNAIPSLVNLPSSELFVTVVDDAGPQAPTIIFIHGLGGWHKNYEPIVRKAQLAKTHRIVYFDLEGLGLSPLTGSPITIETYAQSVKEVLDHVGVQRAVRIANTFASSHSEMVEKLFLIGPVKQLAEACQKAGYARACEALASALDAAYERVTTPALLLASEEDKTSPKANIDFLASELPRAKVCTLKNVAHWHVLEDVDVTADALKAFTEA